MSNNLSYRVFPKESSYKTVTLTERERGDIEGLDSGQSRALGILVFFVIAIIGYSIFGFLIGAVLAVAGSVIAVTLVSSTIKSGKASDMERQKTNEANHNEEHRVKNDAQYLTHSLISTYDSSKILANEIPNCLNEAASWLRTAEAEYKANAFAPFWDAVEQAAIWLGDYNYKANQLANNANEYYQTLNGVQHTFPIFPAKFKNIPDASFVISELYRITRLGQTNFHFANIWEHRRTRKEIVAGFRTLNDAINDLGDTIEGSISKLQNSIFSDLAKVIKEQIRTRESVDKTRESIDKTGASIDKRLVEQNRMLDNIQHEREPKIKDIPSKR